MGFFSDTVEKSHSFCLLDFNLFWGVCVGNLLFLAVVSHFGAKLHRPRLIAAGCFLMAVGAFLTGLTHFFMGRYRSNLNEKLL